MLAGDDFSHAGDSSPQRYVAHHLKNWTYGQGFWTLNLDSLGIAILTGLLILGIYIWMSRRLSVDKPSRFQLLLEWPIELVQNLLADAVPKGLKPLPWLGPFSLVTLLWIGLMNLLDLLPLDLAGVVAERCFHLKCFRMVPTVDPNITLGLALGSLIFSLIGAVQLHGWIGLCKEVMLQPFPHWSLAPFNLCLAIIERFTRLLSLGMRLFGNLIGGELIFAILSILCPFWAHWIIYLPLSAMHLFVAGLQAFIFMLISTLWITSAYEEP